jgi:hypothetical protein
VIVAKLVAVLWAVVLVGGLIAWGIVEAICQGVRKINQREAERYDAETQARLGAGEGARDGRD